MIILLKLTVYVSVCKSVKIFVCFSLAYLLFECLVFLPRTTVFRVGWPSVQLDNCGAEGKL